MLFPTTLVGSYPQPEWLIDRAKLAGRFPPRVRARELWRIAPEFLGEAQNDATLLAIRHRGRGTHSHLRRDSGGRAIKRLPPRSRASISTIPARRWSPGHPIGSAQSSEDSRRHAVEVRRPFRGLIRRSRSRSRCPALHDFRSSAERFYRASRGLARLRRAVNEELGISLRPARPRAVRRSL